MPQALLIGLYLRDAAGLQPPEAHVPPVDPPLSVRVLLPGLDAAGAQWSHWWADAVRGGPEVLTGILPPYFPGLRGMPELRGVAELLLDEAVEWGAVQAQRHHRLTQRLPTALSEVNLVHDLELRMRRRLPPVELEIVHLPVSGRSCPRLDERRFLVPLGLRADRDAYLTWLGERLEEAALAGRPPGGPAVGGLGAPRREPPAAECNGEAGR